MDTSVLYRVLWNRRKELQGVLYKTEEHTFITEDSMMDRRSDMIDDSNNINDNDDDDNDNDSEDGMQIDTEEVNSASASKTTTETFQYLDLLELGRLCREIAGVSCPIECDGQRLLIREEYCIALKHLNEIKDKWDKQTYLIQPPSRAILGNPGIGKSLFLAYVLVERLLDAKPTAWQSRQTHFYVFEAGGARRVTSTPTTQEEDKQSELDSSIWALADSNQDVKKPCSAFITSDNKAFLLQATSCKLERYKEWVKQKKGGVYFMKAWTWPEIAYIGHVSNMDIYFLWHLYSDWTKSARTIFELANQPENIEDYAEAVRSLLSDSAPLLATYLKSPYLKPDQSSKLVVIIPRKRRSMFTTDICGREIENEMDQFMRLKDLEERKVFYKLLAGTPETASLHGTFFERQVHLLMTMPGYSIDILSLDDEALNDEPLKINTGMDIIDFENKSLASAIRSVKKAKACKYLKPIPPNYASFDSLIIDATSAKVHITLLQITVAENHPINIKNIDRLKTVLGSLKIKPSDRVWKFVFCYPEVMKSQLNPKTQSFTKGSTKPVITVEKQEEYKTLIPQYYGFLPPFLKR